MTQQRITAAQLPGTVRGSRAAHEELVEAVRVKLVLHGLEGFPIYTGGIPRWIRGQLVLTQNPHQIGIADMLCPFLDVAYVGNEPVVVGRTALLEMKTGTARRSAAQVRVTRLWESCGALCLLVRSTEDVDPLIAAHQKAEKLRCRTR